MSQRTDLWYTFRHQANQLLLVLALVPKQNPTGWNTAWLGSVSYRRWLRNETGSGVTPPSNLLGMAIDALMLDNSGTKNVPVTDLEWDDWVPASATRNYVLGDPLLDWLDQHGETKGFVQDQVDERTDFTEFIFGKGIEFERRVVDHLRALDIGEVRTINAGGSVAAASRNLDLAVETWHAMVDGVAVIDQGVLRDPASRTYGLPDLLVRSDVLAGLFPENLSAEQATVAAPDLGIGNYHYVVVDIKYTTLNLAPSGLLSNSGSSVAYKTQLHIYNRALSRLQGYQPPRAFLLGRGWKQTVNSKTNKVNNCMDRLASVEHNEITPGGSLFLRSVAAAGWIRRMRRDGDNWDVLPQPDGR